MKIRSSFVSNSSSSSFIIYGDIEKIDCAVCKSVLKGLDLEKYTAQSYCVDYEGYKTVEEYQEDRYHRDEEMDKLNESGEPFYIATIDQNDDTLYDIVGTILKEHNIEYRGDY